MSEPVIAARPVGFGSNERKGSESEKHREGADGVVVKLVELFAQYFAEWRLFENEPFVLAVRRKYATPLAAENDVEPGAFSLDGELAHTIGVDSYRETAGARD